MNEAISDAGGTKKQEDLNQVENTKTERRELIYWAGGAK